MTPGGEKIVSRPFGLPPPANGIRAVVGFSAAFAGRASFGVYAQLLRNGPPVGNLK
jgi:hypothetical protein